MVDFSISPDPQTNVDGQGPLVGESGETNAPAPHPFMSDIPESMPSGMGEGFFIQEEKDAQQDLSDTASDTLNQSIANSLAEFFYATPQAAKSLLNYGSDNLEPMREELTKDIPLHLHDNIMGSLTEVGAKAKRQRILEDLEVSGRLAKQTGISSTAVQLATGLLDADLPLMFMTGGTVQAAKTARSVANVTAKLTKSTRASRVAGDTAVGLSSGGLSGLVVGGLGATVRDDYDVNTLLQTVITSAATGGVLNPITGSVFLDKGTWSRAAQLEYQDALRNLERDFGKAFSDPTSAVNSVSSPNKDVDVKPPFRGPVTVVEDTGVGAAQANPVQQVTGQDALGLKDVGAPDSIVERSVRMQEWKQDYRFQELYDEDTANPLVRVLVGADDTTVKVPFTEKEVNVGQIAGTVFTLAQRDFTNLVRSKSPTANFVAAEILESSSGLVRSGSSSGVLKEFFHGSAMIHSAESLVNARAEYFRANKLNPIKVESQRQFSREVRLAMDELYRTGKAPTQYKELIDSLDKTHAEILERMKGLEEDFSVRGSRDIQHRSGYFRYDWEPKNFLRVREQAGEKAMIQAFRDGYMRGSGLSSDLAERLAKAVVRRFSDRGLGVGAADARLLDLDSRSGIEAVLEQSGVSAKDRDSIMRRLDVNTQERAKKGFLKQRTDVDLNTTIPGTNLKLVDLMSDDLEVSVQRYVGDAAGSAALAYKGIRDQADINSTIDTILFEQSAVGESGLSRQQLEAVFSQFTGGAHKGIDPITGMQTNGVSGLTSMFTKATRASLLQRAGLTQLMDTANIFVANGLKNGMEPVMARLGWNKPGAMSPTDLKNLHDELQSLGVIVGQDHMLFRPHLSIDETAVANNVYAQVAQSTVNSVERATSYASGQIHVTGAQQMVAAAASATNVMRTLAGEKTNLSERMLRDIGLREQHLAELQGLISTGDIVVNGGKVELNSSTWSPELRVEFGAALMRTVHQQAQKGLVGETSVWMNSDIGKLLTSLKTFALVAVQKQTARNLMVGGKAHFLSAAAWQLGFSYAVLTLGQTIQNTDMSATDRARLSVAYTPTLGTIPMVTDPVTTMLGFDDLNFSPYGRYTSYLDTPVFDQTQKLMKAPGALMDMATGDGDYDDMQNAKAMFFLNWYGMKRVWENM